MKTGTQLSNIFQVRVKYLGGFLPVPGEQSVSFDTLRSGVLVKTAQNMMKQKVYC